MHLHLHLRLIIPISILISTSKSGPLKRNPRSYSIYSRMAVYLYKEADPRVRDPSPQKGLEVVDIRWV